MIFGIDPGTEESGIAFVDMNYSILKAAKMANEDVISLISTERETIDIIIIESLHCYGQRIIGQETFETAYFIGEIRRKAKDYGISFCLFSKPEYARAICGVMKVTDAVLWQALKLRFGGDKKGEPLNILKGNSDKKHAYALCVYYIDLQQLRKRIKK